MGEEKISEETLERYIELEREIRKLEKKNVRKNANAKKKQLEDVTLTMKTLEENLQTCQNDIAKEKADVDKINKLKDCIDKAVFDERMSKEEAEYIEALNREEVIKRQLDGIKKQLKDLNTMVDEESVEIKQLNDLEEEKDKLLSSIFKGEYGSELENKLEADYELYLEKKERISVAKYKWTNAKVLLQHACTQLALATKRWHDLLSVPAVQTQMKYQVVTEARNNLIACVQNMRSCQRYLSNIEFPYCKAPEIDTLEKATTNIYVDMQSTERHKHAYNCYHTTHRRAAALLQWFDNVISTVIEKDYKDACKLEAETGKALREERLRLIKEKLEAMGLTVEELPEFDDKVEDFNEDTLEPELIGLAGPDVQETEQESQGLQPGTDTMPAPTPIPLRDLAPPPSKEMMFGNIEQLKKQHEKEMTDFQKAQEMNKARLQQGLEEKLAARRNRRCQHAES